MNEDMTSVCGGKQEADAADAEKEDIMMYTMNLLWMIDELEDQAKLIDRNALGTQEDLQLYEQVLTLTAKVYPTTARYAKEAFDNVLMARGEEKTAFIPSSRDFDEKAALLHSLLAIAIKLSNEDERRVVLELLKFIENWPEQFIIRNNMRQGI